MRVVAANGQHIEGVELSFLIVLARVQRVEVRDAVQTKDHGFAIDDEVLLPVLQRGLGDPGIPPGPIASIARQRADAVALPDDQAMRLTR